MRHLGAQLTDKSALLDKLHQMQGNPCHPLHGTPFGYAIGCRCSKCCSSRVYHQMARWQQQRRDKARSDDDNLAPHGTASRYRYGCRCDDCKAAHTEDVRRWRSG